MFNSDVLLAFLFMAVLFLRQISILKQPNKINYAPLMLGIGAISSIVHFVIYPSQDVVMLLRESIFPFLVALLLYIVMNILHQTQQTETAKMQDEFTRVLVAQVTQLKEFMGELEARMIISQQEDRSAQEELRVKFKEDIKALEAIKLNQGKFLEKFEAMEDWHKDVSKEFEQFIHVKMPSFDEVVHKHINILRIAEQEHHNQLKVIMEKALESKYDSTKDISELKASIQSMKNVSEEISKAIVKQTLQQISGVTQEFQKQLIALKSYTESVKTSLHEGENTLASIRQQSEIIMKQMSLSANKMTEIEKQNEGIHNVYSTIKELMRDMEVIKSDYVKSKAELSTLAKELKLSEGEHVQAMKTELGSMKTQLNTLGETLTSKIDASLTKLDEHYHMADDDISKNVQFLAKRSQLKQGYTQN